MEKKTYSKVLPLKDNEKVVTQVGWLPLSVIEPPRQTKKIWKNAYLNDGLDEQRRSDDAKYLSGLGFSEFHAGLTEDVLHYWSVVGSVVVDPFAGRATRAFVTSKLGREYYGYEISPTTVDRVQKHLDSYNIDSTIYLDNGCYMKQTPNDFADLVMTCPPYHQLEKYESVDNQLSDVKEYVNFLGMLQICAVNIKRVLKPGGFLVWVCADWRDGKEFRSFHSDSIRMFKNVGLKYHDIVIMKNKSPFASMQLGKVAANRYTSKVHEYILVFRKEGELEYPSETIRQEGEWW
jgi:DNA modification methylase